MTVSDLIIAAAVAAFALVFALFLRGWHRWAMRATDRRIDTALAQHGPGRHALLAAADRPGSDEQFRYWREESDVEVERLAREVGFLGDPDQQERRPRR